MQNSSGQFTAQAADSLTPKIHANGNIVDGLHKNQTLLPTSHALNDFAIAPNASLSSKRANSVTAKTHLDSKQSRTVSTKRDTVLGHNESHLVGKFSSKDKLLKRSPASKHVLLLSVDGLHQADLEDSQLKDDLANTLGLAKTGVSYTNASSSKPSDSFPGTLSYLTGASAKTTGVYYDVSYDRSLTQPGGNASTAPGTEVAYDESIDKNPDLLSGGGDFGVGSIDPSKLPLNFQNGSGSPVYPHSYSKVNTIFDVAKAAGLHTAFSDKHPAYDIANGASGSAIDDFYAPEINAKVAIENGKLVDASTAKDPSKLTFKTTTTSVQLTEAYDDLKVKAILNQINGLNSKGTSQSVVPALFGMNFQAVSVAQKDLANGGIATDGKPSAELEDAIKHTDESIGRILDALKQKGLSDSTTVVVTAKHGQSPRVGAAKLVKDELFTNALSQAGIEVAHITQDDVALLWLKDQSQTATAASTLQALKDDDSNPINRVLSGSGLQQAGFGDPGDGRTPDLIVKLKPGYVLVGNPSTSNKRSEHGGLSPDDTHVPIIVGGGGLSTGVQGTQNNSPVKTTQIAVTALKQLGLGRGQLQGAVAEDTKALPGLRNGQGIAKAPDRTIAGSATATTPQGWFLTPAGKQVQLVDPNSDVYGDRPYGMAISPDGKTLLISNDGQSTQSLMVVDRVSGKIVQTIPYKGAEALYIGVTYSPDGKHVYASAGGNNKIRVYDVDGQQLTETAPIKLPTPPAPGGGDVNLYAGGLTISADGNTLYVADNLGDAVSVIDLPSRTVKATVPVGHNPYTVILSKDGKSAYVSNWGEETLRVLDVSGAIPQVKQTIQVGTHPNAMSLNSSNAELYVANADSDNVSVIDTQTNQVTRTIDLSPYPGAKEGSSPNALTVSPDGDTLYVANATNNDIAVVQLGSPGVADQVEGLIPTAWYPSGLVLSPDGKQLNVINAKGLGAGPNPKGPHPYSDPESAPNQYIGSMIQGSLSQIDVPDPQKLQKYTQKVIKNNGFNEGNKVRVTGTHKQNVIPLRPGDASPIKHVIYVIKENRTYDQVLGSLGKGNGDPTLNLFGDESAPNQRALAKQFVTLDNFYADAEVSADGWNWSTGALANTYVQKNWPADYADDVGRNRPYDFEGGNYATSPGKNPQNAFIWNKLSDAGISYRNYGFRVFGGKVAADAKGNSTEPRLAANTDLDFPGYNLTIADSSPQLFGSPKTRIDEWQKEFKQYEDKGNLPKVEFVRLPNNHTSGTKVGAPTPRAYMADNDQALGKLVDTVSHSQYWKSTAIFVVEDDAQDGPDHVDAHRTVTQVISPYTQTGKVDSTFYSTVSMLRSIELLVGIDPMSQYDAAATPMLNSFTNKPNFTPYTGLTPTQSFTEKNPVDAPLATKARSVNWKVEDQNETLENQMIWKSIKGAKSKMPKPNTTFRQIDAENAKGSTGKQGNKHGGTLDD